MMADCGELYNTRITYSNETWNSIDRKALQDFNINSYFRPDTGAALLPWMFTLIVIIAHLPIVIIRVVKWENVQIACMAATFFTIVVYVQAYVSTGLSAEKVLVWTPLILAIDGGSMLQIFFLVLFPDEEVAKERNDDSRLLNRVRRWSRVGEKESEVSGEERSMESGQATFVIQESQPGVPDDERLSPNAPVRPSATKKSKKWRDLPIYGAFISLLLLISVIALQVFGLQAAVKARKSVTAPMVRWCSPDFQPFGIAVLDGDCNVYEIDSRTNRGIGCVLIPGIWQKTWLTGTIVGTALGLAFQLIDFLILWHVSGTKRWRGLKMRRPWTTIIWGLITLCLTFIYSYNYSSTLPPGITSRVTIAVDVGGLYAFEANLTNAGMRGTVIAWNDGIFSSWKGTYTPVGL